MMFELIDVTKKYGNKLVLDRINLKLDNAEGIYGILGRNGVGKTTLMKAVFNMITNYEGDIKLNGETVRNNDKVLTQIAFVGGEVNKHNRYFQGKIKEIFKVYEMMYEGFDRSFAEVMLTRYGIALKDKYSKLSTGNKTLVQNTLGLATRTPITIFDEPTNGLDSVNRQSFFQYMMEDYENYPRMFILSTHLIQEVENYLTDIVILKKANILMADTLENIQAKSKVVVNYRLENKHVISERQLGSSVKQAVFDDFTQEELATIKANGGEIQHLDLQNLFNILVEK